MSRDDAVMLQDKNQQILLQTEPGENVPGMILANAGCRNCGKREETKAEKMGRVGDFTMSDVESRALRLYVDGLRNAGGEPCRCESPVHLPVFSAAEEGSRTGDELVICGAGPSLAGVGEVLEGHDGEVWGCNSALNYLVENGHRVTHGVCIDPSTRMFGEVWTDPPPVTYYLATTVNPGLTDRIYDAGHPIKQWHSLRGRTEHETTLYGLLYPPTILAWHGLNVVNRALDLASWLGFSTIKLVGVDSALGEGQTMYADGERAYDGEWWLDGEIDGRVWHTKPDMLMSACELVRARRDLGPGRVEFVGDVLPRALQDKDDAFLKRCVDWVPWEEQEKQGLA